VREGPLVTERRIHVEPPVTLSSGRPVVVAGRLVREGEPVAGAQLRMGRASATSRGDGTFELRGVPVGTSHALVAVEGGMHRLRAEPAVGAGAAGELLVLDLALEDTEEDSEREGAPP
jgi:hypothetical protein